MNEMPMNELIMKLTGSNQFISFVILAVISFFLLKIIVSLMVRHLDKIAAKTENYIDDLVLAFLKKTKTWFIFLFGFYLATKFGIPLPDKTHDLINKVFLFVMILQMGIWGHSLIGEILHLVLDDKAKNSYANPVFNVLNFILKTLFYSSLVLLLLSNLGINVSALITGLGIGGIAIALAVQNILVDLFASVTIALDKPFEIGDYVVLDGFMGHIQTIGIKTTRLRSISGEEIIISNADLLKSKIRNYHRMQRRRVSFEFGVTYDTKADCLNQIPEATKNIVDKLSHTTFERCHFKRFGDFSLVFEIVFWVEDREYSVQMEKTHRFNIELMNYFKQQGIAFARATNLPA